MKKSLLFLCDIAGWYGAGALLLAYMLVSFSWVNADGTVYQFLNLTGAVGIVIVGLARKTYQPAVLNSIWAAVALIAIMKMVL